MVGRSNQKSKGYLLDTHIFLWWLEKDKKLTPKILQIIANTRQRFFVSVVSAWEISIKAKTGNLPLKTTIEDTFDEPGFEVLPVTLRHVGQLHSLPPHHKDPFDLMLVAQAMAEKLTLITSDEKMKRYNVRLLTT